MTKLTLHKNEAQPRRNPEGRRKTEGHEIALAAAKKHNKRVDLKLMDGTILENCPIQGFDRYTITIYKADGRPATIFKHAVAWFAEH